MDLEEEKVRKGWMKFFFGTPKRFAVTALIVLFWAMWFDPRHATMTLERLVNACTPLVSLGLAIMIIYYGMKKMIG